MPSLLRLVISFPPPTSCTNCTKATWGQTLTPYPVCYSLENSSKPLQITFVISEDETPAPTNTECVLQSWAFYAKTLEKATHPFQVQNVWLLSTELNMAVCPRYSIIYTHLVGLHGGIHRYSYAACSLNHWETNPCSLRLMA